MSARALTADLQDEQRDKSSELSKEEDGIRGCEILPSWLIPRILWCHVIKQMWVYKLLYIYVQRPYVLDPGHLSMNRLGAVPVTDPRSL